MIKISLVEASQLLSSVENKSKNGLLLFDITSSFQYTREVNFRLKQTLLFLLLLLHEMRINKQRRTLFSVSTGKKLQLTNKIKLHYCNK